MAFKIKTKKRKIVFKTKWWQLTDKEKEKVRQSFNELATFEGDIERMKTVIPKKNIESLKGWFEDNPEDFEFNLSISNQKIKEIIEHNEILAKSERR